MGVDSQNSSIRSARRNAELNTISNCHFIKEDVQTVVGSLLDEGKTFDTVILDPPRHGAPGIMQMLGGLKSKQIIYVSCNPATLSRDLVHLSQDYYLQSLVPVDMFPQTHHLESVALLKRLSGNQ